MGKYLSLANDRAQHFQPLIEQSTGIKLEDVVVKGSSEYPGIEQDKRSRQGLMFVSTEYPDTIFFNQKNYHEDGKSPTDITVSEGIAHELSHLTHRQMVKEKWQRTKKESAKARLSKRYWKSTSFREGFAEYMALTHLLTLNIYDEPEATKIAGKATLVGSSLNCSPAAKLHKRGYKFFRKVLSVIGQDKVYEVARSPPISEKEIKIPLLYLLRRYPIKGLKSIPKVIINNTKSKILIRKYGCAGLCF